MECILGVVTSIASDLVSGALNQLRYPCCFNNFVKQLEEEEGNLIVTRDSVQKFVAHAKRQTRKTSEVVDKWLQDASNDVYNVNELLKEARTKTICCFEHCPNWIWRYRVGKKLANKTADLEKLIEEGKKYAPLDRIATLPSGTLDILSEKCMNFESRQSAYDQLLEAVRNTDVSIIGLYGMGGCGKTTLAMEVRKVVEADHLFDKVLFVPISSVVEVRRIQEKIASSLQFEFPETEEMERAQRLCLRLTQEKNILVILDDVWEKLDFGRIGIPSSEHHKGCKILITTRSEEVCTSMDCQRKIYLPILTEEEAWTLFQNKALISEGTSDTLKRLGRLISNECKGLPVAIAAVASSLKGKAETIWSVALNKLKSSKPINIERGLTDPYKCLQLSYDNLDTEEAKSLFLLCSVFPEDYEIPVELLTRCAIGLGVVGEAHSYEEARSEVIAAKIKLVSSCLLLDEENKEYECVKMHDIVRDVAQLIAKNENSIVKCEVEKDVTLEQNSVRYLWCKKFPHDLDCSNLEFLCLQQTSDELDGIFKKMRMLKVLILFNDEDETISQPKMSFKTLTNLRFLLIFNCELSDFSFVNDMKKLQSLSLYDCSLPSFPELQTDVAITQLTSLKLLELCRCDIKGKKFEVMKRTPLLEELYIVDIEGDWDPNSEDNIEFFNTFSVPQTLQRYGIVLGSRNFFSYYYEGFSPPHKTLLLNYFHKSNEVVKSLAKEAKDLYIANIEGGAKNMIPDIFEIEEGGLDELIKFEIRDSKEIECLIDTSNHLSEVLTLSKLNYLSIYNMENLRTLWHCFPHANGLFENLKELYLWDCPRLTSLFTYDKNEELDEIIEEGKHPQLHDTSIPSTTVVNHSQGTLSSLVRLRIVCCLNLGSIFTTSTSKTLVTLQHLTSLEIIGCPKLTIIFPKSLSRCLPELIILKIRFCKELRQILEEDVEDKTLSNLSPQPCFPKLEALCIEECPKLKTLFTGFASNDLPNLHFLIINGASELEDLVRCGQGKHDLLERTKVELPRLQILIFMRLSNFHQETKLPNLKNCIVCECPKLSLTSTTTLEELRENYRYEDFENIQLGRRDLQNFIWDIVVKDSTTRDNNEFPSSQETGNVGNQNVEEGSGVEEAKTKSLPNGIEDIQEIGSVGNESVKDGLAAEEAKTKVLSDDIGDISTFEGGFATHIESSVVDILAQHSKVVEQDDKMNEGKAGIVPSQEIQVEEGLNLLDKQEGIDIVSNNNVDISPASADIRTRLEAYKHFVDLDDAQIDLLVEAITTYPHLWNVCEKFSDRFQAWRLKVLADILLFLQKANVDNVIPQREQEFHKLCEEAVEIEFESSWVDEMRQCIVARDPKLRECIAQKQMDENPKRSSSVDMELDSEAVEQGDGPNENYKRTTICLKSQNTNSSFEEGSNSVDKESEIDIVSNDCIVALTNEVLEKENVAKVSTLKIPRITTSLTNSQSVERPTPLFLRETPSNALVHKQHISELRFMNQQKPLGEIVSSSEIPQSIEPEAVEQTIARNTDTKASSIHSESTSSQLDQMVNSQSTSHSHGKEGEDNRVGKTLVELEKYLKISLKDIVSSETNSLRLLSALNFLSNLPFKDVTLSDELNDIIDIMHKEFPSILFSFKEGYATINKLAVLEAQLKGVVSKEQIIRLSSLGEEKNKYIAETKGHKMELENVRKDISQIVEDQRKVRQELFEVAYKWSIMCSQYELNRMAARNSSRGFSSFVVTKDQIVHHSKVKLVTILSCSVFCLFLVMYASIFM